ncbi:MAG: hypothetical protein NW217_01760 [Hyphomicrobiaceae bacterium]|nr:hypothetical protein [Hyphomicrobiaceae bacterium]
MKMLRRLAIVLMLPAAGVIAGCGGGVANPFAKASGPELMFISAAQTWDLDRNNSVTCDEWKAYTAELFGTADKDGDGILTSEEYQGVVRQDRLFETAGMAFFDTNRDGRLTAKEMADTPNPAFAMLDRDKDCQIASAEMVQTRQIERIKETGDGTPNIGGGGPGGPGSR